MKKLVLTAALGAACLGLTACGDTGNESANGANTAGGDNGTAAGDGGDATGGNGSASGQAAGGDWPAGTRIVQEGGVTYRVNADGTRVQLTDNDARIVVENGVRYRVNREGTRVRIDERGIDVDLDGPDIRGVDVDVGTNRKGNLDIDVNTNGQDATPNR